jgi:hypothetical protein
MAYDFSTYDFVDTGSGVLEFGASPLDLAGLAGPLGILLDLASIIAKLIQAIIDAFDSAPDANNAMALGMALIAYPDAFDQYLGIQLIAMAQAGFDLDSGFQNTPTLQRSINFIAAGMFNLANAIPPHPPWNGLSNVSWNLGDIVVFKSDGSRTTTSVNGFFIDAPIGADQYQSQWGHPLPTLGQFASFLQSGEAPNWKTEPAEPARDDVGYIRSVVEPVWHDSYRSWLARHPGEGVPSSQPPPSPAPSPGPTSPPSQPPGGGDELTDCCAAIVQAINNLAGASGAQGPIDYSKCCDSIAAALGGIRAAVDTIAQRKGGKPSDSGAPIDLKPIEDVLKKAVAALEAYVTPLASLADCVCKAAETPTAECCDRVVEQLKRIADAIAPFTSHPEKFQAIMQYVSERQVLDPQLAQVISS